ncbi:MAG: bifunctional DNA-formamidopyrimidine glycosylase/DNA-(apurinic or apyrimidinic site) lyase [Deltaproteobacteria bacterium]|nr:bifunctional DNA-formamidopyrimidine glycosylase/DNA-(apurinic or apyrimidinic site) lyase [Deltaproteobacteria bacterium]
MPELPEVETIRLGLEPLITGKTVQRIITRTPKLRAPLEPRKLNRLQGKTLVRIERRGKYLLFVFSTNWLLVHLGMSGTLVYLPRATPHQLHDHVDLCFTDGSLVRLHDPRRFGLMLFFAQDPLTSPPLAHCGPEPLSDQMNGAYLFQASRNHHVAIKNFLLDQKVIAGLGNIYVNEALFLAHIHPEREACRIELEQYETLAASIRAVLRHALEAGGTTLRDYRNAEGKPGYFAVQLQVYGRAGQPCPRCGAKVQVNRVGQRSTFFCRHCQK